MKWKDCVAIAISALLLLIPAFYNGYPLVNPDTATYLASGFKPETPFDRPITYGLFIRLFSLNGLSLWFLVFAQGIIVSSLIFRIIKSTSGDPVHVLLYLAIMFVLSVSTSLSWLVSQVQPDVFTSIAFMCILLLLIDKEGKKARIALYVLFFISVAVHLSHPLLMVGTLLCLLILRRIYAGKNSKNIVRTIVAMIVLSASSIVLMGAALSKSKHVYFIGSLLEKGVLKEYLDERCATHNYKICAYKDSLGSSSDHFIWESGSPLYKIGDWKGTKPEFNAIIHDILTSPRYLWLFMTATMQESIRQAMTFNIGDGNDIFPVGSNLEQRVSEYFPHEAGAFHEARQNQSALKTAFIFPNNVFAIIILLSVAGLVYRLLKWKLWTAPMKIIVVVCTVGVLLNIMDCAAFSVLNGRYGCKMIWLLPFAVVCTWVGRGRFVGVE